jgi:hypothetical protein
MTFRPAHDEFRLVHADLTVTMRPSLRAATILEHEYGFDALFAQIHEFRLGTIRDIIMTTAIDHKDAAAFLASFNGKPLAMMEIVVKAPLNDLCRAFIPETDKKAKTTGKPMTWPDYYGELYRLGTGWLGWTPRTTWRSTPAEINEAFAGHVAMLKAIHGSDDDKKHTDTYSDDDLKQINELGYDPAFDHSALQALQSKIPGGA